MVRMKFDFGDKSMAIHVHTAHLLSPCIIDLLYPTLASSPSYHRYNLSLHDLNPFQAFVRKLRALDIH